MPRLPDMMKTTRFLAGPPFGTARPGLNRPRLYATFTWRPLPILHLWYIIYYFEGELGLEDQSPYWKMTADFGRRSLQMHIDWAEQCAAELRSAK